MAVVIITIYFALMMAVGPWAAKKMKKKNTGDFILAGRSVPLYIIIGGIFATLINSASLMGYAGSGYSLGIAGYFAASGFTVVIVWMGFWVIPHLRKMNLTTIPEFFERNFGWPHRVVSVVLVMCRDMGVTAGASVGMAVVFQSLFDIPLDVALLITLGVTLVFTVLGGMWAVMVTDAIQGALILIGTIILVPIGIVYIGGWETFLTQIPTTHIDPLNAGISQTGAWIIGGALTCAGYQTLIQRGLSADSDKTAKKGFIIGGFICMGWYIIPFLVGTIAIVIFPDITPSDAFLSLTNLFGEIGGLIFSVLIIASCISTLSSTILTTSSNLTLDIYKRLFHPGASEKQLVFVTKLAVILTAILGTLIGRSLPFILELLLTGGRIMGASLSPVLLALIFWPVCRKAYRSTISAMIGGAIATIIGVLIGNGVISGESGGVVAVWTLDPTLVGLPVTLIILIIGTLIETRRNRTEEIASKTG